MQKLSYINLALYVKLYYIKGMFRVTHEVYNIILSFSIIYIRWTTETNVAWCASCITQNASYGSWVLIPAILNHDVIARNMS